MDRFVGLGRARVLAQRPGPRREVLRAVLLGRSTGGEEAVRLQSQELGPRRPNPAWRWAESALSKHRGDGRGRDIDPEFQELPADPEVAPPGVLPAQPKDQVLDRGIERRTTRRPRATPASSLQELPVPSRQGVRADQEALPPVPGQDPSRRCEERPIRRGEEDSPAASAEDPELVVEHDGLKIQLIEAAADEHAEQPAQKPVPDGPEHLGSLMPGRPACERPGRSSRLSFFTPQVPIVAGVVIALAVVAVATPMVRRAASTEETRFD